MQPPAVEEPLVAVAKQYGARTTSSSPALPEMQWHLMCEWVAHLLTTQISEVSSKGVGNKNEQGGSTWTCATGDGDIGVTFDDVPATGGLSITTWGVTADSHRKLVERADSLSQSRTTRTVYWHATFNSEQWNPFVPNTALHSARSMDQARRLTGRAYFGSSVLLDFAAAETDASPLASMSPVNAKAYFALPGAYAGPRVTRLALDIVPNIRACVAFCLGTTLHIGKFRPLGREEEKELLASLTRAPVTLQLAVDGLALGERLDHLIAVGAAEASHRILRAMACYETALQQHNAAATIVHLVSAIEALARPNYRRAWHNRITQRFSEFMLTCVPEKLVETLRHGNFSAAFPGVTSAKSLVAGIYGARSSAVHDGLSGEFHEFFGGDAAIRVLLIADVVRSTIIEFLRSPFSSLVGHPAADPEICIKVRNEVLGRLRARAETLGITVDELLTSLT